jgi:hypothetical protein
VPVSSAALPAALITLLAGAALGITGFMAHLTELSSQNNEAYMEVAQKEKGETLPLPSALSGLALFTFILLTPQGWISTYLTLSGLVRAAGSQFDDPHGDLLLTALDAAAHKSRTGLTRRRTAADRERREGPRVRDRVMAGADLGLPDAELVVIASRVKDGWTPGTVVLSERGAFRILAEEDRTIDGRLRRLYSLAEHKDLEAIRRSVRYEFPRTEPRR